MREILFRGKRVDNSKWVYGIPVEAKATEGRVKTFIITHAKWESDDNSIDFLETDVYEIASETVGEYTGLTDKNGTKIFEGDIITYDKEYGGETREKGTVYWCDGAFWVENVQDEEGYGLLGVLVDYQLEIIGNIHDNSELLEANNE